jgi:hypothetical protein
MINHEVRSTHFQAVASAQEGWPLPAQIREPARGKLRVQGAAGGIGWVGHAVVANENGSGVSRAVNLRVAGPGRRNKISDKLVVILTTNLS